MSRDLESDLAICEAANLNLLSVGRSDNFTLAARKGWPYAIRRALEAEKEIDHLRNELNILQEQLLVAGRCWD